MARGEHSISADSSPAFHGVRHWGPPSFAIHAPSRTAQNAALVVISNAPSACFNLLLSTTTQPSLRWGTALPCSRFILPHDPHKLSAKQILKSLLRSFNWGSVVHHFSHSLILLSPTNSLKMYPSLGSQPYLKLLKTRAKHMTYFSPNRDSL